MARNQTATAAKMEWAAKNEFRAKNAKATKVKNKGQTLLQMMQQLAKRLDCGVFSAAFARERTAPMNRRNPNAPPCQVISPAFKAKTGSEATISSSRPASGVTIKKKMNVLP
jgi:hypothetical protein